MFGLSQWFVALFHKYWRRRLPIKSDLHNILAARDNIIGSLQKVTAKMFFQYFLFLTLSDKTSIFEKIQKTKKKVFCVTPPPKFAQNLIFWKVIKWASFLSPMNKIFLEGVVGIGHTWCRWPGKYSIPRL